MSHNKSENSAIRLGWAINPNGKMVHVSEVSCGNEFQEAGYITHFGN